VETGSFKRGELLRALHGRPGDHKRLRLERSGKELEIDASVTAF
jgi:hypothetical protein